MTAIMVIIVLLATSIVSTRYVYVAQSATKETAARVTSLLSAMLFVLFLVLGFCDYANSARLPERRSSLEVRRVQVMRKISRRGEEISIKTSDVPEFVQLVADMKNFNRDLRLSQDGNKGVFSLFILDRNINLEPLKLFN